MYLSFWQNGVHKNKACTIGEGKNEYNTATQTEQKKPLISRRGEEVHTRVGIFPAQIPRGLSRPFPRLSPLLWKFCVARDPNFQFKTTTRVKFTHSYWGDDEEPKKIGTQQHCRCIMWCRRSPPDVNCRLILYFGQEKGRNVCYVQHTSFSLGPPTKTSIT